MKAPDRQPDYRSGLCEYFFEEMLVVDTCDAEIVELAVTQSGIIYETWDANEAIKSQDTIQNAYNQFVNGLIIDAGYSPDFTMDDNIYFFETMRWQEVNGREVYEEGDIIIMPKKNKLYKSSDTEGDDELYWVGEKVQDAYVNYLSNKCKATTHPYWN